MLRADDPLASREAVQLSDLADRRWFQFPPGTDRVWSAYWTGKAPDGAGQDGPVVRTTRECIHAVMWNDSIGLAPLTPGT